MIDAPEFPQEWKISSLLEDRASSHQQIDTLLDQLREEIEAFEPSFPGFLDPYQKMASLLEEAGAVILCLTSKDVTDTEATKLEAKHSSITAQLTTLNYRIDQILVEMDNDEFEKINDQMGDLAFTFRERREHAKDRMDLDKEMLVADLSVPGFSANTSLYYSLIGSMEFEVGGKTLNISQVENLLSSRNREEREEALAVMESTLSKYDTLFAQVLNNICDFRLRLQKHRGWDHYLHESLQQNRMSKPTLDAMWKVIVDNKKHLKRFMDAKAKYIGVEKLSWCDAMAPIGKEDGEKLSWDDSCKEVLKQFGAVSPKLQEFATNALKDGWVDSIQSNKKRGGGFCVSMPASNETRILLTFNGSPSAQATLAHELGHSHHAKVIYERPYELQHYPMNLAESASTMCETIVSNNAIQNAENDAVKLGLLDHKLTQYLAYSMNLHSRFIFESNFHEESAKGFVTPERLSEIMQAAQREAYEDNLAGYFDHFWAYKMHFYFADVSFYNWTYTFGYLFSLGMYNHLSKTDDFETAYEAILRDTGSMSCEDLAKKHLAVDLTEDEFWQDACSTLTEDIDEFIRLSQKG